MKNIFSAFDGISVLQHSLNIMSIQYDNYYASEIDLHSIKVTMSNYPKTIQLGDIAKIDGNFYKDIYLFAGGSPCQNLSIGNIKREGINGQKSKLFFEYVRLLDELKPKYFLYENVASMSSKDRDVISMHLKCDPYEINTKYFSAQDRNRYYWTNIPIGPMENNNLLLSDIIDAGYQDAIHEKHENSIVIDQPNKRMVGYINNKNRGNRVYSPSYKAITLTANSGGIGRNCGLYLIDGKVRRLSPIEAERLQCLPDNYTLSVSSSQRFKQLGNSWNSGVIQYILKNIK